MIENKSIVIKQQIHKICSINIILNVTTFFIIAITLN